MKNKDSLAESQLKELERFEKDLIKLQKKYPNVWIGGDRDGLPIAGICGTKALLSLPFTYNTSLKGLTVH
jgi:hypothetical protein